MPSNVKKEIAIGVADCYQIYREIIFVIKGDQGACSRRPQSGFGKLVLYSLFLRMYGENF